MTAVAARLAEIVGAGHVRTDPAEVAAHARDWTGRFAGTTPAVVEPADTAQVAAVLAACGDAGAGVVPQGGNTGLVAGAVPHGEVVLDLRRLSSVHLDPLLGQVSAGAGVTIGAVQAAARAQGLRYGVDLASRDTATVGGTIATNAAGLRAVRLGDTRSQVVGLEVVLASGAVLTRMSGLTRDAGGYDLPRWVCGSEGTLAVVTAAQLRLLPAPGDAATALLAFGGVQDAMHAAAVLRREPGVEAIELMLAPGVELVCAQAGLPAPFAATHAALLLVEATDRTDAAAVLEPVVGALPALTDAAVGVDAADARRLWAYRELHTEAISRVGVPHKLDVALPLGVLAGFLGEVSELLAARWPAAQLWVFGHAGEGNLHVNITGVAPEDEDLDDAVLRLTAAAGGSISAEHGIGRAKRRWLPLVRSAEELALWRSVKSAFDPAGVLNPGVLFDG